MVMGRLMDGLGKFDCDHVTETGMETMRVDGP